METFKLLSLCVCLHVYLYMLTHVACFDSVRRHCSFSLAKLWPLDHLVMSLTPKAGLLSAWSCLSPLSQSIFPWQAFARHWRPLETFSPSSLTNTAICWFIWQTVSMVSLLSCFFVIFPLLPLHTKQKWNHCGVYVFRLEEYSWQLPASPQPRPEGQRPRRGGRRLWQLSWYGQSKPGNKPNNNLNTTHHSHNSDPRYLFYTCSLTQMMTLWEIPVMII